MGSHSVTCHPTQVSAPRLNPSHAGRYSIYLPRRDGRLSLPCYSDTQPPGVELVSTRAHRRQIVLHRNIPHLSYFHWEWVRILTLTYAMLCIRRRTGIFTIVTSSRIHVNRHPRTVNGTHQHSSVLKISLAYYSDVQHTSTHLHSANDREYRG